MPRKQNDFSTDGFTKTGEAVAHLGAGMQGYRDWAVYVTGVSIRGPQAQGGEFLATIRGITEDDERVVAFHGAFELTELFKGISARLANGSLKWREDQFKR